jgi:ribonuclease J
VGAVTDAAGVRALGDAGVLAMICDSTNVFVEGESGSEAGVRESLIDLVRGRRGRVAITAFASNVARLETAIMAAQASGRSVCLVGRSMHKIVRAAQSVGLLQDAPPFVDEEDAGYLPPESVLYLCTGSQGEARAALSRIAGGTHRHVVLGKGDTVIFSSRMIPGNELSITALIEQLQARGVTVITASDAHTHVSGHPAREELKQMYQWARPRIAIPVHGERRHLIEHAALAQSLQVPQTLVVKNGDLVRLAPGDAEVVDETPAGRLHVDGDILVAAESEALMDRRRLAVEGTVTVSLAISEKRGAIVSGPDIRARGLPVASEEAYEAGLDLLAQAAEEAFLRLDARARSDDEAAEQAIIRAVRKASERVFKKRPLVDAIVLVV